MQLSHEVKTKQELDDKFIELTSSGFVLTNFDGLSFEFDIVGSYTYEATLALVYLIGIIYYFRALRMFHNLTRTDLLLLVMLKNFENKSMYDSEDEDTEVINIGSKQIIEDLQSGAQAEKEMIRHYKKTLLSHAMKFRRNYLDCKWILSFNKHFYMLVLALQLVAAMTFNGIFDIPALVMILVLMSSYALRKSFFKAYGLYVLFIVWYIQLAMLIKLTMAVLFDIDYVEDYLQDHKEQYVVKLAMVLFGMNFTVEEEISRQHSIR
jgi:hypothetical protein